MTHFGNGKMIVTYTCENYCVWTDGLTLRMLYVFYVMLRDQNLLQWKQVSAEWKYQIRSNIPGVPVAFLLSIQ